MGSMGSMGLFKHRGTHGNTQLWTRMVPIETAITSGPGGLFFNKPTSSSRIWCFLKWWMPNGPNGFQGVSIWQWSDVGWLGESAASKPCRKRLQSDLWCYAAVAHGVEHFKKKHVFPTIPVCQISPDDSTELRGCDAMMPLILIPSCRGCRGPVVAWGAARCTFRVLRNVARTFWGDMPLRSSLIWDLDSHHQQR